MKLFIKQFSLPPAISSPLGPHTLIRILLSNTINPRSSLREKVKLYIFREETKIQKFCAEWSKHSLSLICS
jgi:hypothetical protein